MGRHKMAQTTSRGRQNKDAETKSVRESNHAIAASVSKADEGKRKEVSNSGKESLGSFACPINSAIGSSNSCCKLPAWVIVVVQLLERTELALT